MDTILKDTDDPDGVSSLVIGTESGHVLILDPPGNTVVAKVKLGGVPAFLAVTGLYDVEYRVVIACRNGMLYTLKNGEVTGIAIELETQPCGLARIDKMIYVACMDRNIHCYHIRGKKTHALPQPAPIACLSTLMLRKTRMISALLVGLDNGEVRVYNGKFLVHTLVTGDPVASVRFGGYGREDNTLVVVHRSGALTVKMLTRTATLEASTEAPGPPPEQDMPLNVPKKTKLYVDQTQREREHATEMHRVFQVWQVGDDARWLGPGGFSVSPTPPPPRPPRVVQAAGCSVCFSPAP
jgi:Bardet-Biedl syndrome 1 protein